MTISELIEEAHEQCGLTRGAKDGYDIRTARRSLQLIGNDWDNKGLNFWRIVAYSEVMTSGVGVIPLSTDTVDLLDVSVKDGDTGSELPLDRIDIGEWQSKPNKTAPGRPLQIFVHREQYSPVVYVWPVPNKSTYTITGWRMRTDEAAGYGDQAAPVPDRFVPALIAGLAYELGKKLNPSKVSDQKVLMLKADYDEKWARAEMGDTQRVSIYLRPNMRGY